MDQAIVSGMAAEYQVWEHASVTRQELLGQLGVEYWLHKFQQLWGIPRQSLSITLITDSQVSIDLLENVQEQQGIKDTLKADMDVALEIFRLQQIHAWTKWRVQKVESHIDRNDAPDEYYWDCNNFADTLASKAREIFPIQSLKETHCHIFEGARAGVTIQGRIENNRLYSVLKSHINGSNMKQYLLEKYHWNDRIFANINWRAHHKAMRNIPRYKRVTLHKYVHGWLATNVRRHREGMASDDKCPLCGGPETRDHVFRCTNAQMKLIRVSYWKNYKTQICQSTGEGFKHIFLAGLDTIGGASDPTIETKAQWPEPLRAAYEIQSNVGWTQVLYGRIAQSWDALAQYKSAEGVQIRKDVWTNRAITLSWRLGLELWSVRNQLVHGTIGNISSVERKRVNALIQAFLRDLVPYLDEQGKLLFQRPEDELLLLPYQNQVAWLGRLRFLYPIRYLEIERDTTNGGATLQEREYIFLRQVH